MTFINSQDEFTRGGSDQWLGAMLSSWEAPAATPALDQRVFESFRTRFGIESSLPFGAMAQSPMTFEVNQMKTCEMCNQEFSEQFAFCPIDGTTLVAQMDLSAAEPNFTITEITAEAGYAAPGIGSYHLTLLDDAGLVKRLTMEMRSIADESRLTWPEFREHPVGFARRSLLAYGGVIRRGLSSPNVVLAGATACAVVIALVVALIIFDQERARQAALAAQNDELVVENVIDIPDTQPTPDEGAAGMDKGKGGGSKAEQAKPHGGGGGGREEQLPASQGKLAQASNVPQVVAPNPDPPPPTKDPLLVPPVLDADPTLFPTDTSSRNFGDPTSKTTATSSGPGTGNGIGSGEGAGVGDGKNGGFGPGEGGNTGDGKRVDGGGGPGGPNGVDYNRVFRSNEVNQKARIISKPSPEYTEEARVKQTTGTVRLSAVFSSTGQVLNIRPLSPLPNGLTEKAINAAKRIQFTPAVKDGRPVSSYVVIEYNFNIY